MKTHLNLTPKQINEKAQEYADVFDYISETMRIGIITGYEGAYAECMNQHVVSPAPPELTEEEIKATAKHIYQPHPAPNEYWYPNCAVIELEQAAYVKGVMDSKPFGSFPAPAPPELTEEKIEQEANREADKQKPNDWLSRGNYFLGYKHAMKKYAFPAPAKAVEEETLKDIAQHIARVIAFADGVYVADILKVLQQYLNPKNTDEKVNTRTR